MCVRAVAAAGDSCASVSEGNVSRANALIQVLSVCSEP